MLVKPLKIVFILIGAMVATRLVRRLIRRFFAASTNRSNGRLEAFATRLRRRCSPPIRSTCGPHSGLRPSERCWGASSPSTSGRQRFSWCWLSSASTWRLSSSVPALSAWRWIRGPEPGQGLSVRHVHAGRRPVRGRRHHRFGRRLGVVEGVSLRTTRLRAVDGTVWHVPNGEVHVVRSRQPLRRPSPRRKRARGVSFAPESPGATCTMRCTNPTAWV